MAVKYQVYVVKMNMLVNAGKRTIQQAFSKQLSMHYFYRLEFSHLAILPFLISGLTVMTLPLRKIKAKLVVGPNGTPAIESIN